MHFDLKHMYLFIYKVSQTGWARNTWPCWHLLKVEDAKKSIKLFIYLSINLLNLLFNTCLICVASAHIFPGELYSDQDASSQHRSTCSLAKVPFNTWRVVTRSFVQISSNDGGIYPKWWLKTRRWDRVLRRSTNAPPPKVGAAATFWLKIVNTLVKK